MSTLKVKYNGEWQEVGSAGEAFGSLVNSVGVLNNKVNQLIPVGTIYAYSGSDVPTGWFICDGEAYKKTEYPELYAVIGDKYNLDDDTDDTKFRVPDYRGRFLEGSDIAGEYKEAGLPNLEGSYIPSYDNNTARDNEGFTKYSTATGVFQHISDGKTIHRANNTSGTYEGGYIGFDASQNGTDPVYGKSDTVQPPSVTVRYIIKAYSVLTNTEGADVQTQINTIASQVSQTRIPVGTIMAFAGAIEPNGWRVCDGSVLNIKDYPDLYRAIGKKYSKNLPEGKFALPNLIGRFLEGGLEAGAYKEAGLPNIKGSARYYADIGLLYNIDNTSGCTTGPFRVGSETYPRMVAYNSNPGKALEFDASFADPIYGNSDTVQPASLTVKYIIKVYDILKDSAKVDVSTELENIKLIASTAKVPLGSIQAYMGNTTPDGWLLCNGASYATSSFPKLARLLGQGDSPTFRVPNLNGRFLEGGAKAGEYHEAGLPNITGELNVGGDADYTTARSYVGTGAIEAINGTHPYAPKGSGTDTNWDGFTFDASRSSSIYGNSDTVQPASLVVRYIIKAYDTVSDVDSLTDSLGLINEIAGRRHVIEENYSVPNSDKKSMIWYRRYNDGWLEQGFLCSHTATTGETYVLTLPFRDENWWFSLGTANGSTNTSGYGVSARNATDFKLYATTSSERYVMFTAWGWEA